MRSIKVLVHLGCSNAPRDLGLLFVQRWICRRYSSVVISSEVLALEEASVLNGLFDLLLHQHQTTNFSFRILRIRIWCSYNRISFSNAWIED